jgi:hypothetical protein
MVFGSLLIAFGLSWWSSVTAITIGVLIGSVIFSGVAIQSHKTGTNNAVRAGAFFGVTGRYLGSASACSSARVLRNPRLDLGPDDHNVFTDLSTAPATCRSASRWRSSR